MSLEEKLRLAPDLPGVYLIRDADGTVLYVGKARSLRKRLRQHFRQGGGAGSWNQVMRRQAADFDVIVTNSEVEALILESTLIKERRPRYNIRLADDKSYPYLRLTDEPFPRLQLLRDLPMGARPQVAGERRSLRALHDPQRHTVHSMRGRIFGPFADARSMRRTARLASQLFGLRSCRKELTGEPLGRPCLNFHIKRCLGPCTGAVPAGQYEGVARQVELFLQGKTREVERDIERRMRESAEALDFERAATLRDSLKALRRASEGQIVVDTEDRDEDVVACATHDTRAMVVLMEVRAGRLVRQQQYPLRRPLESTEAEILDSFLTQHYSVAQQIPRTILVGHEVRDRAGWEEVLGVLRGGRVRLHRPLRGAKRALVDLAQQNARVALARTEDAGARRAEREAALADLAELLGLRAPPVRIECFDVATLQGDRSTASQVVFTDGAPDKAAYRRFRIRKTVGKSDDYAMLREAIARRLEKARQGDPKFLPLPDLILVDGGKGQVSAAGAALEEAGVSVPLAGLAKEREEVFLPGRSEPLDTHAVRRGHLLLQRVRDEAHRFANAYHQTLRARDVRRSDLDDVPGIGPRRKQALLRAYASVAEIAAASIEELASVPGMNRSVAQRLQRHLGAALQPPAASAQSAPSGTDEGKTE